MMNNRTAITLAAANAAFGALLALGFATAPHAPALPPCAHEDGNTDGRPCAWTDPDTGRSFYVTSENYREEMGA
jgi:hypothetical protein